jgi:hypothetical protein
MMIFFTLFLFGAALAAITGVSLLVAFLGGIIYYGYQQEKKRCAELAQLAQDLECSFHEKDPYGLGKQLSKFDLFVRERSRFVRSSKGVRNVLYKKTGDTQLYLFEYSYVVSTGKSAHTVTQTVFFANNTRWSLPEFKLKPETWWHRLKTRLGLGSDINFEEHPDFSKRFWLTGEVASMIREKIGPTVRDFLTERPPVHIEGANYYLTAYKPGKRLSADEAEVFFDNCCRLVQMLEKEGSNELLDLSELKKAHEATIDPLWKEIERGM